MIWFNRWPKFKLKRSHNLSRVQSAAIDPIATLNELPRQTVADLAAHRDPLRDLSPAAPRNRRRTDFFAGLPGRINATPFLVTKVTQ